MNTLKTIIMGLVLVAAPALAQNAAAPVTAVPAGSGATTPAATAPAGPAFDYAAPTPGVGHPVAGTFGPQPQVTDIGHEAVFMHNKILMPTITVITIFVLLLMIWVAFRYRAKANPVSSKTAHNTAIEIVWTLAPVLILVLIAIPSIRLLAHQYATPKADVTIKVIGNQWYWTYQYPDNGDFEVVSNMLKEKGEVTGNARYRTDADGPRLLAVDERMVVPAGKVVKILTTSNDVIHSFAMPAFWEKMDAVPGRINETWFKVPADKTGVYFGQCSELCGARHGYMPIAVEVVSPARYAEWVKSKGGTMPGAAPVASDAGTASPPASPAPAAAAPVATSQPATQN
jgi:cytochrome c oxidase subunit 2